MEDVDILEWVEKSKVLSVVEDIRSGKVRSFEVEKLYPTLVSNFNCLNVGILMETGDTFTRATQEERYVFTQC
jgi:hypothetical protein